MQRLPPLAALEAFVAVVSEGSFLAAAERLSLTPSAISHRIRALENALGVRLFERNHRSVALTTEGRAFHADIAAALTRIADAAARLSSAKRVVRLSVAPGFGRAWLIERTAEYQNLKPAIDFELSVSTRLEPISSGEADLAIRFLSSPPHGLTAWKLFDEKVFPVCTQEYCERIDGLVRPADLTRARLLRHPLLHWADWFAAAGLTMQEPNEGPRFEDGALMLDACLAGLGVALATSTLARSYVQAGRLIRPFDITVDAGAFYLLAAATAHEKPWIEAFARWLAAATRAA